MSDALPVTVAVVTYNAKKHIGRCIETILELNYPVHMMEILIVDGCSEDGTRKVVRKFMTRDQRIRLVENPGRLIASNRNRALREAKYPYVAFTDSDCEVPRNWLRALSDAFQQKKPHEKMLVAVGGGNIPPKDRQSDFLEALGMMLNTFLGSLGSVQGKVFSETRYVDTLACLNIFYDKEIIQSFGGFDLDMKNIGEDAEMHFRLRKAGYRFLYVQATEVYHKLRPTPKKWARNMFDYGRGRMVMFRKHPDSITFRYLLPFLFLGFFILALFSPITPLFLIPLIYFPLILIYSIILGMIHHRIRLFGWIALSFIYTHWCYAFGMVWQLISGRKTM